MALTDIFPWVDEALKPRECNSEELIYDDMESQSGYCLPVIYEPFDAGKPSHWRDRGAAFDFLYATGGEGKRLLDFGPGDGWPALMVAPFAEEVVGVEGSHKRVSVCTENARRLGITNVRFIHVEPADPLPFEEGSFDGAMAASSLEQTPDPRTTLKELHRVLKPGGKLRLSYEDLERYRGGKEHEICVERMGKGRAAIILYDRHVDEEYAVMYALVLDLALDQLGQIFGAASGTLSVDSLTVEQLAKARPRITDARKCRLNHPSGRTLLDWLEEAGFEEVIPSHGGPSFAGELFGSLGPEARPRDMEALDRLLRPLVKVVVGMKAPIEENPPIIAVK